MYCLILLSESLLWLWLDRFSIVLSYVVLFTISAFFLNLLRYRRLRKQLARVRGKSINPRALAISSGGGSIKASFDNALKTMYPGAKIPVEEYMAEEISTQNIHRHEERIRAIKERYQTEAVTELHLSFKGPIALAITLGAIFDNWVSVKVYQHNRDGKYEAWTTLAQAKALPLTDEVAEKTLSIFTPEDEENQKKTKRK